MQNDKESDENMKNRYDFYREAFRWGAVTCLVMTIAVAGEVWKEVWDHMHPSAPDVVGLYPDGRLQQAVRLDKPMLDDLALKRWVEDAVRQTCNIDFVHWAEQLNAASDNLLPEAVDGLKAEMESKNILKELDADRLHEDCSLSGPSWIVQKSLVNNALYYEIKLPMLTRFRGQNEVRDRTMREVVRVVVLQVPRSVKARGFGIAAIQAEPEKIPIDGMQ